MRLVLISDTHGLHDRVPKLPQGDILVHAGDFMNAGYDLREVVSFNRWLGEQPFAHRIVCGGNHDRLFENSPELARPLLSNGIYLEDSGTTIAGFSFWGSPYTPAFLYWAFMYPRCEEANVHWDRIPDALDVLVTHGPPYGILRQLLTDPIWAAKSCSKPYDRSDPRCMSLAIFTEAPEPISTEALNLLMPPI